MKPACTAGTARVVVAAALLATAVTGPAADWTKAPVIEVKLSSFAYSPGTLRLAASQAVTLHLVNDSGGGHNFSAPEFFAAAEIDPLDRGLIVKGTVEVPKHTAKGIRLVPAAGQYRLRCTHRFHTMLGMRGKIAVG